MNSGKKDNKPDGSGEDPMLDVPRMSLACRRVLTAALGALGIFMLLVAAPGQVVAQSAFTGIYIGTFFSGCDPDNGQFRVRL